MELPYNLFHYTSINSLALILANRTMRFSSLKIVNDLSEGISRDMGDLGNYMFVNCWTDQEKEHLPLWNMYTPEMRGVRIKLPLPIFQTHEYENGHKSFVPMDKWIGSNYMIMPNLEHVFEVNYTDNESLLEQNLITELPYDRQGIDFKKIGRHKRTVWEFEREWRFCLYILPKPQTGINTKFTVEEFSKLIDERGSFPIGFTYYDLPISSECFHEMEITLGPRVIPGDKEIVQSLIDKYNSSAVMHESRLTKIIR